MNDIKLIDIVRKVNQNEITDTLNWINDNLFPHIGIKNFKEQAVLIGSAGKKDDNELSGDIDIAVSLKDISAFLDTNEDNCLSCLNSKLTLLGYETMVNYGFNQISVVVPVGGIEDNGYVQVDLMLSKNLKWSEFIYYSPNFKRSESSYKGSYRNLLLMSAISKSYFSVVSKNNDNVITEYETYVIRLYQGVFKIRKSFLGKRGIIKTSYILKEYDKFITDSPKEVVNLIFKENIKPEDINTFEELDYLIHSSYFKYPNLIKDIYDEFEKKLEDNKLELPQR